MKEIWKVHLEYTDYEISDWGRVKRITPSQYSHGTRAVVGNILSPRKNSRGYLALIVCKGSKKYCRLIHRLVVDTFLQGVPKGKEVNHKDGDKTNNRLSNLEIITRSANMKHAYALGLQKPVCGEHHGGSKLSESQISDIRKLYNKGELSQYALAELFGVAQGHISLIVNYKSRRNQA